jgi:hypothetical protein
MCCWWVVVVLAAMDRGVTSCQVAVVVQEVFVLRQQCQLLAMSQSP